MTDSSIIGLFPGQGSQKVGMGKDLLDSFELAQEYFARADKALGFSLSKLCFEGPIEELTLTAHSQPAILTVSVICYELAKLHHGESIIPAVAAGHSLGEYSALVAAGALNFDDAVALVHKRGTYMQEAVPEGEGTMLAVLGKALEDIESVINTLDSSLGPVEVANINAPGQIVISGTTAGIAAYKEAAEGSKMVDLPVSAPFHSSLMQPAAERLAVDLDATTFSNAAFPIITNVDAKPENEAASLRDALKRQVCGRVRWVESMEKAVSTTQEPTAIEFGPAPVLANMLKRINKAVPRQVLGTVESLTTTESAA